VEPSPSPHLHLSMSLKLSVRRVALSLCCSHTYQLWAPVPLAGPVVSLAGVHGHPSDRAAAGLPPPGEFPPAARSSYEAYLDVIAATIHDYVIDNAGLQEVGRSAGFDDLLGRLGQGWHGVLSAFPDHRGKRVAAAGDSCARRSPTWSMSSKPSSSRMNCCTPKNVELA
jgi:hypothetical protein